EKTVSVTGALVSESEVKLNFEISGRVSEIRAAEGMQVAAGEVIAMVDDEILNLEAEKSRAALDKALADAGANDDLIRETEQAVENSEDYLDEVEDLEDEKVEAAEDDYDQAKDYYDTSLDYYNTVVGKSGAASVEAKSAKMQLIEAQNRKKKAEQTLEVVKQTRELNQVMAENDLKSKQEKLKTAKSKFTRSSSDSMVSSARKTYEAALANLEKATLKAPANGKITEINYERGEVIAAGMSTESFAKMLASDYILKVDVPESDIVDIKLGQEAAIEFDSLSSNETFTAQVIEIAADSTNIQDVIYYKVKLKLNVLDKRLKPGMSADADILIQEQSRVLMIPERAVTQQADGRKTVRILDKKKNPKQVRVETGLEGDEGLIEITAGLNKGDQVIISQEE
ncbi:MAG: efflux RND transporter periplasmic adaptor subunit, partial [Candidatus Moranbacteria bacterium]|nr:efflux RND transporter periplasmic adaptor subunit [Candidatus Moranbacteria bacterium]